MMIVVLLAFAFAASPTETAGNSLPVLPDACEQAPLPPHEIRAALRTALRAEATSQTDLERQEATLRLCDLFAAMMTSDDFAQREKERWQARLTARLRRIRSHFEKSASSIDRPTQVARGGGAIDAPGAQQLVDLITTTIDPETWEVHGGKGSIFYYGNLRVLVIRQTQEVHEKIGGTLPRLAP